MKTDMDRLEDELAAEKAELLANLAALEARTRAVTNWRWQVRQRPLAAVGVAAAAGVLLAMVGGRRDPRPARDGAARAEHSLLSHPLVERFASALGVVAAEKATSLLAEFFPARASAPDEPPARERDA